MDCNKFASIHYYYPMDNFVWNFINANTGAYPSPSNSIIWILQSHEMQLKYLYNFILIVCWIFHWIIKIMGDRTPHDSYRIFNADALVSFNIHTYDTYIWVCIAYHCNVMCDWNIKWILKIYFCGNLHWMYAILFQLFFWLLRFAGVDHQQFIWMVLLIL